VEKFWLLMERMTSLILLHVGLVFSHYEFLVVFRQVWVWDRKKEGGHGLDLRGRVGAG